MATLPITNCPDGAGSINNPDNPSGLTPVAPYVPPDLCTGDFSLTEQPCADTEGNYQENLAAEQLEISGATVNVFKLLGVHEQGKLIDVTGQGVAIASSGTPAEAFDAISGAWVSSETGLDVTGFPAFIGYDFGIKRTSYGQPAYAPDVANAHHITTLRITQGNTGNRARQVRIDRSDGGFKIDPLKVQFTGAGNGSIGSFQKGPSPKTGLIMAVALSTTTFSIAFITPTGTQILGTAIVNQPFNSLIGTFTIKAGTIPFAVNDAFTAELELDWLRVDVVNLPDLPTATVSIKQSTASRFWRVVPLVFDGALSGGSWVVEKLELFDYQSTRLDNIQDTLFLENRDRDYANMALPIKAAYTPFDAASDLSKFGFQIPDIYTFTCSFAKMITMLGRPIVVGDVLEVPSELQYDHNLKPVRKFLEVSDVSWAADGRTTAWKPIIYKFTAQQLLPSQEHRDILGTVDTQKYVVDDGQFFDGIEQIQTAPLTTTEANQAEAEDKVPEKGTYTREVASGTNRHNIPGTFDGTGLYVEDGLPPDGQAYTEGFKLPDVGSASDGDFFRLNYEPRLNIAARLYKFSAMKNKWIYVSTDRRAERSAHKPSQRAVFQQDDVRPLTSKV